MAANYAAADDLTGERTGPALGITPGKARPSPRALRPALSAGQDEGSLRRCLAVTRREGDHSRFAAWWNGAVRQGLRV